MLILLVLLAASCRKTYYGTSLSVQNHLDKDYEIEIFPIDAPYTSYSRTFTHIAGEEGSVYHTGVTNKSAIELFAEAFDSIKIYIEGNVMV